MSLESLSTQDHEAHTRASVEKKTSQTLAAYWLLSPANSQTPVQQISYQQQKNIAGSATVSKYQQYNRKVSAHAERENPLKINQIQY